jgi:DNA polymerase family B
LTSERPFVAWDGEAVTGENDYHPYCLFGSSLGWRIKAWDLTTLDCLSLLIETEQAMPEAIHFGFAFGYDVNMILRDLPVSALEMLRKFGKTRFMGFTIEYIPRKWLKVGYGKGKGRTTIQVFDVFSFFGTGLAPTLRKYNIGSEEQLSTIDAGKGERPNFAFSDLTASIEPYWEQELVLMVQLMEEFRRILGNAGIHLASWHGPGAIANYLLRNHHVENLMDKGVPDEIIAASRSAYFGGRFEPFVAGFYDGPVYSADINSAYPYSHSRLPDLSSGKWLHQIGRPGDSPRNTRMGIYRIRYHAPYSAKCMPLPHRDPNGSVSFAPATEGWFHAAEASMVYNNPHAEFLEWWQFDDDGSYPFAWIEDLYEQRLEMQRKGDPTQIAFKLGPNSLYGRVAQRAGWERIGGPPKWHQLEWAGAITSECRSMVYSVARQAGNALVSIDTDGVLSLRPFGKLPNGSGKKLGQWKVTEYSGVLYVQNGIYWLRDSDGNWLPPKSRGIPRKRLEFEKIFPTLQQNRDIVIQQHSFIGFGLALRGRMHDWRKWLDEPREITFGGSGKRIHATRMCAACQRGLGYTEALHMLIPAPPKQVESTPHYLPWLDPKRGTIPVTDELDDDYGESAEPAEEARASIMELEKWGVFE